MAGFDDIEDEAGSSTFAAEEKGSSGTIFPSMNQKLPIQEVWRTMTTMQKET